MGRHNAALAAAVSAALALGLTACGGSGSAAPADAEKVVSETDQLAGFVDQVDGMGIVEWSGQLLTKSPDNGGQARSSS